MAKRPRRDPEPGKFEDPLSNYDEPRYDDGLERSLCEDPVTKVITTQPMSTVAPDVPLRDVIRRMREENINCLVIVENDRPIGIFTERDALNNCAKNYDELAGQPIHEVMTVDPVVVTETHPPARVANLMTNGGFRHIPVVDINGKLIGLIGPRRLTSYLKQHFAGVVGG